MQVPSEEDIKGWEKLMGSPILPEPSEELSRTRFRVLLVGSLALATGIFNLHIESASTILGLKIGNLTDDVVRVVIAAILIYLLIHFIWMVIDSWTEWRLRLTGYERTYNFSPNG